MTKHEKSPFIFPPAEYHPLLQGVPADKPKERCLVRACSKDLAWAEIANKTFLKCPLKMGAEVFCFLNWPS